MMDVFDIRSSRVSVVKVADLRPASLGSIPSGIHMSQWWQQEGHPAIAPTQADYSRM